MLSDIPQIITLSTGQLQKGVRMSFWEKVKSALAAYRSAQDPAQLPSKAETQYQAWLAAEEHEDECYVLSSKSAFTEALAEKDAVRDALTTQLASYLRFYAQATLEPQKQEAAQLLLPTYEKYAIDVRSSYLSQTTQTSQWIDEVEQSQQLTAAIATLGLTATLAQLKTANQEVKRLLDERDVQESGQATAAYKQARLATDEEWRLLVVVLNAYAVLAPNETQYSELFALLNKQITDTRAEYDAERKKNVRQAETFKPEDGQQSGTMQGKLFRVSGAGYEPIYQQWNISGGNTLNIASLAQRLIDRVELKIADRSQKKWGDDNTTSRGTVTVKGSVVTIAGVDYNALTIESSGAIDKPLYVSEVKVYYQ